MHKELEQQLELLVKENLEQAEITQDQDKQPGQLIVALHELQHDITDLKVLIEVLEADLLVYQEHQRILQIDQVLLAQAQEVHIHPLDQLDLRVAQGQQEAQDLLVEVQDQ